MSTPQIYMIIFIVCYFGITIGLRTLLLYKNTKINATKNFGKKAKTKRAERTIQVAIFLLIIIIANFLFLPNNYKFLMPIRFLEINWLQNLGFILSIGGLVLGFWAQLQMKDSWRLGITENENVNLVTTGLFTISRNPIYLGLGISFFGFFFIAPNVASIIFFCTMWYGVHEKIKDEEEFLTVKFGDEFIEYKRQVRKWF